MSDLYSSAVVLFLPGVGEHNSLSIYDYCSFNKIVTLVGNVKISTTQSKFGTGAIYCDGFNSALIVGIGGDWAFLHNNTDFTVEGWVYWSGGSSDLTLLSTAASTGHIGIYFPLLGSNGNKLHIQIFRGVSDSKLAYTSTTGLTANTWTHIAFCYDSSTNNGYFYINGTQAGQGAPTVSGTWPSHSSSNPSFSLAVGRYQYMTPGGHFNGYINHLRITRGVIRYTTSFTAPTVPYDAPDRGTGVRSAGGLRRDLVDGGRFRIRGTVTEAGVAGAYRVRLFDRQSGRLLREGWSTPDGAYQFDYLAYRAQGYMAVAHDHGASPRNAALADLITPEPMP